MRKLLLLAPLLLIGCSTTVPVHMSFPELPEALAKPCDRLEPLAADKKELSDLLENTTDNYAKAKECNAKANAWKEWYDTQRKIFEEVK
jgi:hypothetical protein